MAVTRFQCDVLKLLARQRRQRGESYVAGGVALNLLLEAARRSRDIDLFHDTDAALGATWAADRELLRTHGCEVTVLREAPAFVEAMVRRGAEGTAMQWARDSAYRFFPLVEDERMGLTLHPFDLATNKVLALAGRVEARDWIDVMRCDQQLQPFGYLCWAACGKDPGYNPRSLLATASRRRFSQAEVNTLDFAGPPPEARELGARWHAMQAEASSLCGLLPPEQVGTCVVAKAGFGLFRGGEDELRPALAADEVAFHPGRIGGSWPTIASAAP